MRAAVPSIFAAALLGCAGPVVVPEGAVAVRARRGPEDSALALSYPSSICSVTLRDESGALRDREQRGDATVPVDMTRALPQHPWERMSAGAPGELLAVLALPPGRYTLTAYAASDDFDELERDDHGHQARMDCSGARIRHGMRVPIRIEPGKLTLLDLPGGVVDFPALRRMSSALQNEHVAAAVASWSKLVRDTGAAMHRQLAERQRQRHDGYDVYPSCDGRIAVVRSSGKPFPWYRRADDEAERRRFRVRASAPLPARSIQATGFGNGCVKDLAFVYMLTDARELEPLAHALGRMMVEEDLAGELDLVLTGPVIPQSSAR